MRSDYEKMDVRRVIQSYEDGLCSTMELYALTTLIVERQGVAAAEMVAAHMPETELANFEKFVESMSSPGPKYAVGIDPIQHPERLVPLLDALHRRTGHP